MRVTLPLLSTAGLLVIASIAPAQMHLACTGDGGSIPGTTSFALSGTPRAPWLLLVSEHEQRSEPVPGLLLHVGLELLSLSLSDPRLSGTLDAAGKATTSIPVPAVPALHGAHLSFQSLEVSPLGNPSNLVRVTLQQPDTFLPAWEDSIAPIITGQGFVQPDGKVLLVGGSGPVVQEYDPTLERFRLRAAVPSGNVLATQTQLDDGTILVTGGIGATGQPVAAAFVFDPATGKSTKLPDMASARAGHAAARLRDGRVLIAGGAQSLDFTNLVTFLAGIQNTSEFFDPKTKTFAAGPALLERKMFHSATALSNGEVLVAGGLSVVPILNVPIVSPIAQSYIPALNLFGLPALMATGRMLHGATALGDGRALLAGGVNVDFSKFLQTQNPLDLKIASVADAVAYRPGLFGGFTAAMKLSNGRLLPAVAAVGSRGALIAGGFELDISASGIGLKSLAEADLFDGTAIAPTGRMRHARVGAVAVPLPDGTVLIAGGGSLAAEIFQPR